MNQPSNNPSQSSTQTEVIDIKELIRKYIKNWHWFFVSIFFCVIIAFLFIKRSPLEYEVTTSILLRQDASKGIAASEQAILQAMGLSSTSKEVEDEIQIIQSKTLIREVIKSLDIQTEYYSKNRWKYDELYTNTPIKLIPPSSIFNDTLRSRIEFYISKNKKGYNVKVKALKETYKFFIEDITTPINTEFGIIRFEQIKPLKESIRYKIITYPTESLVEGYRSAITVVSVNKKSNAISISHISACVPKSKNILNKMVDTYNLDAIRDKNLITMNAKSFIDERLEFIVKDLSDIEQDVERYKKQNKMADIDVQAELLLKNMSEYEKERLSLETQLSVMSFIENSVKDKNKQFDFIAPNLTLETSPAIEKRNINNDETPIPSSGENNALQKLIQEYNTTLIKRTKLLSATNSQNPVIIQIEQELSIIRENILSSIASSKEGMIISLKEIGLKDSQFEKMLRSVPTQEREFIEIKRQQKIKEELFVFLLKKQEEAALTLASAAPSAKTIDAANTSTTPISPRKNIILLMGLILGAAIPMIIIYLIDFFNNKINNKNELLKVVKAPYLGNIAQISNTTDQIVVKEGVISPVVEMFKLVRANLRFMIGSKESPVILITSSFSGEGKSFVALNLAMSFALMQKKIVIVGLDIRSPKIAEYLNISRDNGITVYLSDNSTSLDSIIHKSSYSSYLDVIPAGPTPPNPSELLMTPRLDDLFEKLRKKYDYIIVDSAPIAIISDTYLLNRIADNTIYVTRENYTPKEILPFINEIYEEQKLKNIAVVLNGSKEGMSSYGYGYGSYFKQTKNKKA